MEKQIEEIESVLHKNGFYPDVYQKDCYPSCTVTIFVEGDWKHDHLYIKHLLSTIGFNEIREDVVGSQDSDYYKSEHTFMYASEDSINALKEIFKSK